MKKNNDTPKEQFICSVCGKEISGDHVIIQTRRHTTLHIHYECMRAGRQMHEKVKLFLTPHIEIRIHVSEEMERDYAECQKMMKRGEDYDCDRCSWANVSIYGTGACELKGLKEQLGGISGETDGKER